MEWQRRKGNEILSPPKEKILCVYTCETEFKCLIKQVNEKTIHCIRYEPKSLSGTKIKFVKITGTFIDCNLGYTDFKYVDFRNCKFYGCSFFNSTFNKCIMFNCNFKDCNFGKTDISSSYIDPKYFKLNLVYRDHNNIATHLFQELKQNSAGENQSEFFRKADYLWQFWKMKEIEFRYKDAKNEYQISCRRFITTYYLKRLDFALFGFGYNVVTLLRTAICMFLISWICNYSLLDQVIFQGMPNDVSSQFWESFLFTSDVFLHFFSTNYEVDGAFLSFCIWIERLCSSILLAGIFSVISNRIAK